MATLKSLRMRINSVRSTQKITRAMKAVAASKLRRAQETAYAARPYAQHMERILASLAQAQAEQDGAAKLLVGTGSDQTHLLVVATGDRGLCGAFNSSIARAARRRAQELLAAGKQVKILCVGRKGRDVLRRDFGDRIIDTVDVTKSKRVGFMDAEALALRIAALFEAGEFDCCTVFYNHFVSAISQVVTEQALIPARMTDAVPPDLQGAIYDFEPEEDEILAALLPRNLAIQIYCALLENAASEQGARMSAMENATRNAGEMIKKLTLAYNRSRQAVITKELIEIISGAEAI